MPAALPITVGNWRTVDTQFVNGGASAQTIFQAGPWGARVHAAIATANQGSYTPTLTLYKGQVLTNNALPSPGHPWMQQPGKCPGLDIATTTTITRTNGSYIVDGWQTGNLCFIANDWTTPANQVVDPITVTSATTLTLTNAVSADTTPNAALQLVRVVPLVTYTMVQSAGLVAGTGALNLLDPTKIPLLFQAPDVFLVLGPYEHLVLNVGTLPSAGNQLSVYCAGGDL